MSTIASINILYDRRTKMAAAGVVAFLFFASSALAASVAETVRRGNEALAQGNFDKAIATYKQADVDGPGRAELLYNQAVAHYRKGEYEQARGLFTQAIGSEDGQLEAKARFNLADCDYAEAVALAKKDKPAAIDRLHRAISHFRGALQANPSENGARANIELAQLLIKKLQQQEKQQQKQQKQQDQQKQDQQKQQDQKDKKRSDENQQDDNQKSSQDQQQKDQQKNKGEQKQDESTKSDKQKGDEKEESNKQEGKQGSEQSESQKQEQNQKQDAEKQQQQDQPSKSPQDEEQQQPPQQQQAGGKQQDSDNQAAQSQGMPQFGGKPTAEQESRPMTKEEAQKMLQAVRDRNLMRRLEQMEQRRSRHIPVDRDW